MLLWSLFILTLFEYLDSLSDKMVKLIKNKRVMIC